MTFDNGVRNSSNWSLGCIFILSCLETTMKNDEFGDRMKSYEKAVEQRLTNQLPVYARIDGRCFSTFTRKLQKPFDHQLTFVMDMVTTALVLNTNAKCGFVQSDEISLVWEYPEKEDGTRSDIPFNGNLAKLNSTLASQATSLFIKYANMSSSDKFFDHVLDSVVTFDCRVLNVPSRTEAANMFLWRAMDAKKNGVQSIARSKFSHKELQGKSQTEMLEMLGGIYGSFGGRDRYGAFVRTSDIFCLDSFNQIENREGFIFDQEQPIRRSV